MQEQGVKKIKMNCKICQDIGYLKNDQNSFEKCKCLQDKIKKENFGEYFVNKTFKNFEIRTKFIKIVKETLQKNLNKSFYISGKVGTGKTHLLAGLWELFQMNNKEKITIEEVKLLEKLKNNKIFIDKYDIIMLDDIGKVKIAEWDYEKYFNFYNDIYKQNKQLVLTSNYLLKELTEIYGIAIIRRIDEMIYRQLEIK